jgi:serine/threonine protein phosphatase PrpC
VGWATDVGEVRRHNEDSALIITAAQDGDSPLPEFGLFVLADGMGGHQAGEVASSLAARTVAHHIVRQLYLPALVEREPGTDQPPLNDVLIDAIQAANRAVADSVPGGGTTLTCALMLGPRAYIGHVGDSRAYVVTPEGLDQITHDHSLVDRLVELGQLTRDEAATHPQKNVLYRAVGQRGMLEVDTYTRTITRGERLLLCSDGLWSIVSTAKMIDVVTTAPSPQAACDDLVTLANRAGGPDNITIILVEPPP